MRETLKLDIDNDEMLIFLIESVRQYSEKMDSNTDLDERDKAIITKLFNRCVLMGNMVAAKRQLEAAQDAYTHDVTGRL